MKKKKGFWATLIAKPWAIKIHYKDAIREDNIIDIGKIELELGIVWLLLLIVLIII